MHIYFIYTISAIFSSRKISNYALAEKTPGPIPNYAGIGPVLAAKQRSIASYRQALIKVAAILTPD
jgi:hypothetical protein